MEEKVWGKIGTNKQQIGGECPGDDWVGMFGVERESSDHFATKKGLWVLNTESLRQKKNLSWRNDAVEYVFEVILAVKSGERTAPTFTELIDELPIIDS